MTHQEIAARLRALADPHSFLCHGYIGVYPGDDTDDQVVMDDRALQGRLIALAEELDPTCKGHVMPLDDPHFMRLDFSALPLPRSAA